MDQISKTVAPTGSNGKVNLATSTRAPWVQSSFVEQERRARIRPLDPVIHRCSKPVDLMDDEKLNSRKYTHDNQV
jgi:hypothetical protein